MVKHLGFCITILSLTGCGFVSSVWNAKAPERKNITITGAPLPSFNKVFEDEAVEAEQTLNAWHNSITNSFNQIKGSNPSYLSVAEIQTLVKKGFVSFDTDPEVSSKRVKAILEILGFKDGITIHDVHRIFEWLAKNREQSRSFYKTFLEQNSKTQATSRDLVKTIDFLGSLLILTGDEAIEVSHLNELFLPWIPEKYSHAKNGLKSGLELGIAFFSSFCGDRVDPTRWNGKKIGVCLSELSHHFEGAAPTFDFIFGTRNPLENREILLQSAAQFPIQVKTWLQDHHHPRFQTSRVSDFAKAMDIPPPYAFFDLTAWLPKLNADSTPDGFSPSFFIDLAQTMGKWIVTTTTVMAEEKCESANWKTCEFKGSFEPADQLYSEEYASLIRSKDLGFVRKIALYDSLAEFVMTKFDANKTGKIEGNIKELINISIRLLDTNAFAQNVLSRALERPFDPSTAQDSLKSIERQGLSELAAFVSELIPTRAKNKRSFLKQLEAQIVSSSDKNVGYSLDRLGITTFLYLYDLINNLRQDYLDHYALPVRVQGPLQFVKRRQIVEAMPRMLYDHFPHIYNECLRVGFEKSCGILYTEVLPDASEGSDELETYEMDVLTLTSILLESMMNRCDRNQDDRLSSNILDGNDEKHCMLTVSSALAKRLINANIVAHNKTAELLMMLVKRVPFVRWAAKTAMSRGTIKNIAIVGLPPFSLLSGSASLGSVLSLAAEFMDSDKVKAVEAGIEGPASSPGENLIYLNRMTNQFLPSKEEAPRTSKERVSR